jgi:hypothetical protein
MKCRHLLSIGLTLLIVGLMVVPPLAKSSQYAFAQPSSDTQKPVRDSAVVLLDGKTLPANDFIHLYDTTPYMVMNGHITAKLPCNENSESTINVLIGQAPNLKAADLELVTELSKAGEACLYHVDVESQPGAENGTITDIAIQNPTNDAVEFGSSATVVIGVNEIAPIAEEAGAMGNMTMSNSTD